MDRTAYLLRELLEHPDITQRALADKMYLSLGGVNALFSSAAKEGLIRITSAGAGGRRAAVTEAGLSYLGVGSQPPYASLGRMLSDAQQYMFTRPSYVLCPGIVIVLMVLGFAFLGEGIKRWE